MLKSQYDGRYRDLNKWYSNNSEFVSADKPWFARGGAYYDGILASQFNFTRNAESGIYLSTRLVLSP